LQFGTQRIVVTMKVIHFHKRKSSDASTYMQKISLPAQSIHHNSIFNWTVVLCIVWSVTIASTAGASQL
jgi:hypothetical protein